MSTLARHQPSRPDAGGASGTDVRAAAAPARGGRGHARRRVLAQVKADTLAVLRNGEQMLVTVIIPAIALVGLARFEAIPLPQIGGDRVPAAFAGALALAISSSAFPSQAISLAFDRRWGVLRMLATTPLGPTGLLLGRLGAVLVVLVIQAVVLGAVAAVLDGGFGFLAVGAGPLLGGVVVALLGAAAFLGLGVLIGGTLRAEAVLALANTLWALLAAGGGLLVAPEHLPGVLGALVAWLPSAALGDGMRAAFAGAVDVGSMGLLAAWALVLGVLAARHLRWD